MLGVFSRAKPAQRVARRRRLPLREVKGKGVMMKNGMLVVMLVLAACATPQDKAAAVIARHAPYCEGLGFTRNTDAWRQCIIDRERAREADARMCYTLYGALVCN